MDPALTYSSGIAFTASIKAAQTRKGLAVNFVNGYNYAATIVQVLKQAGSDLSRENIKGYALLRTSALALSFVAGIGLAAAQQQPPPADPQQQSNAVFVNGALAVPGAPANTDTVPAKFSAKNAADDKLIIIAYTFKTLTDEQRRAIYQALKDQPSSAFNADVGTELPPAIELRPVPNEVAARVPQTRDYRYVVANGRVLLVGTSRIVVGVFGDANAPVSEGR